MQTIQLKEENRTATLQKEGYVIMPVLSKVQIEKLRRIFYAYHQQDLEGFYATTHLEDTAIKKELSDQITAIVKPLAQQYFKNMTLLGGAFIAKYPGPKGVLPLHQDWNIVDEQKARSYNMWIPLLDVTQDNGAIKILPKSHTKQHNFRGPGIPSLFREIPEIVDKQMTTLEMKAGEALLYDHALWHCSPANHSDTVRLCVVLGVIPKDIDLKYYCSKDDKVAEYDCYPNFFFDHKAETGADHLSFNRYVAQNNAPMTADDFYKIYTEAPIQKKRKRWFHFFSK
ncbi:MAG: phytanoyl-CoA dioxygenase family protein [Dokdonia sp.]|jgi:hypothetical protein